MTSKCCFSSTLTSRLLEWRNPQGKEEHWVGQEQIRPYTLQHLGGIFATEIASVIFATTAVVEVVVYGVCFLGSIPFSNQSCGDFYKRVQSGLFTVAWNLSNFTFFNLLYCNLPTHESMARSWLYREPSGRVFHKVLFSAGCIAFLADRSNGRYSALVTGLLNLGILTAVPQMREEDLEYVFDWSARLVTTQQNLTSGHCLVKEGKVVNFWTNTFQEAVTRDEALKTAALESQPEALEFLMTRCFHHYWGQLRQNQSLPKALGPLIIAQLTTIHQDKSLNLCYDQLKAYAENFETYKQGPTGTVVQMNLSKLKTAACTLQEHGKRFLKFCLKRACRGFNKGA
jgi:hypothetical protein